MTSTLSVGYISAAVLTILFTKVFCLGSTTFRPGFSRPSLKAIWSWNVNIFKGIFLPLCAVINISPWTEKSGKGNSLSVDNFYTRRKHSNRMRTAHFSGWGGGGRYTPPGPPLPVNRMTDWRVYFFLLLIAYFVIVPVDCNWSSWTSWRQF